MKVTERIYSELRSRLGDVQEAGDYAGKYFGHAIKLLEQNVNIFNQTEDLWADIFVNPNGKLYAVAGYGNAPGFNCFYMEISKEECPEAFEEVRSKFDPDFLDLIERFKDADTFYAPGDFCPDSKYATGNSSRCACGESRAMFYELGDNKLHKVICCDACYKDAAPTERFI